MIKSDKCFATIKIMDPHEFSDDTDDEYIGKFEILDSSSSISSADEGGNDQEENIGDYLIIVEDNSIKATPKPLGIYVSQPGPSKRSYEQILSAIDQIGDDDAKEPVNVSNLCSTLQQIAKKPKLMHNEQGYSQKWFSCEDILVSAFSFSFLLHLNGICGKYVYISSFYTTTIIKKKKDKEIYTTERYTEYSTSILDTLHNLEQNIRKFYDKSPQSYFRPLLVGIMKKFAQTHQLSRAGVHLGMWLWLSKAYIVDPT